MKTKHKKNEKGFTLIELIMVIVIIGIISAVAIPKFVGLSSSARLSTARGIGAAINGTIQADHANLLINGAGGAYTLGSVLDATNFSGGISYVAGVPANTGEIGDDGTGNIDLVLGTSTFTWSYTDANQTDDIPAVLAELNTSDFP